MKLDGPRRYRQLRSHEFRPASVENLIRLLSTKFEHDEDHLQIDELSRNRDLLYLSQCHGQGDGNYESYKTGTSRALTRALVASPLLMSIMVAFGYPDPMASDLRHFARR